MRIRDQASDFEEQINLLPLIDTLVFLVIFFLVATQFRQSEREVGIQLPGLSSSQPLSAVPRQLVINVTHDGQAVIGGKTYSDSELEALLASFSKSENQEVLVRADERSLHKYFAHVAAVCRRAGIGEMKIGYIAEEQEQAKR